MIQKTILLIEEEAVLSPDTTAALRNEGYNVIIASDYISSLNIINRMSVDLIIVDEVLPHADGFGIVEYIKRNSKLLHIPVIQVREPGKISFPFYVRPDALITKPVEADKLLLLISSCLTNRLVRQVG